MTYAVDFKKSGKDLLLGLLNYDNSGGEDESLWSKAQYYTGRTTESISGSEWIAHTPDFIASEGEGFVVKKEVTFATNSFRVYGWSDDRVRVFIDGEMYGTPEIGSFDISTYLPPGPHTVAIISIENHKPYDSPCCMAFTIEDGGTIIERSDTSWPAKYLGPDETWSQNVNRWVQKYNPNWTDLTHDNVLFIQPPTAVDDGSYQLSGDVLESSIGDFLSYNNYTDYYWPAALERETSDWDRAHPSAKYIAPNPEPAPEDSSFYVKRRMNITSGKLKISACSDDRWDLYVDGAIVASGSGSSTQTFTVNVTPDYHSIVIESHNFGGKAYISFALYDDAALMAVSDASWKCIHESNPDINRKYARVQYTVPVEDRGTFLAMDASDHTNTWNERASYETKNPDDSIAYTNYVEHVNGADIHWTVDCVKVKPTRNTKTIVRALDDIYGVKDVEVAYNRIPIDKLFSLSGLTVPEINLDRTEAGITLNQKVLDEINRRYGVNFDTSDFSMYKSSGQHYLQAKAEALVFIGTCDLGIIDALDTRVPNTVLAGFNKDFVTSA